MQDSYEKGKIEGINEGYQEAQLQADECIQNYSLESQKCRTEADAVKFKLKQVFEARESDERRLNSQMKALNRTIDEMKGHNKSLEIEIDAMEITIKTNKKTIFDYISGMIKDITQPISKFNILKLLNHLREGQALDYSFELIENDRIKSLINQEREEVVDWVRQSLLTDSILSCPSYKSYFPDEEHLFIQNKTFSESIDNIFKYPVTHSKDSILQHIDKDVDVISKRYNHIIKELVTREPELELHYEESEKDLIIADETNKISEISNEILVDKQSTIDLQNENIESRSLSQNLKSEKHDSLNTLNPEIESTHYTSDKISEDQKLKQETLDTQSECSIVNNSNQEVHTIKSDTNISDTKKVESENYTILPSSSIHTDDSSNKINAKEMNKFKDSNIRSKLLLFDSDNSSEFDTIKVSSNPTLPLNKTHLSNSNPKIPDNLSESEVLVKKSTPVPKPPIMQHTKKNIFRPLFGTQSLFDDSDSD